MSVGLTADRPIPASVPGAAAGRRLAAPAWRTATPERLALVAALSIAAVIVVGMAAELPTVALAGSVVALLGAVVSPFVGLVTLAVMGPLKSPAMLPAPGFNAFLVAAILAGCLFRLPVERKPLRVGPPIVFLFAFVLYVGVQQLPEMLSGYAGPVNHFIGYYFFQLLTWFGAILAAAYVLRDRPPHAVIVAGLAAAVLAAFLAIATFDNPAVRAPIVGLIAVPDDLSRAVGPFGNPNYFGLFAAIAILLIVSVIPTVRSRRERFLLVAAMVPITVALALSSSRGAAVTLFAGLAVFAFARSRKLGVTMIAATVLLVVIVYPAFVQWRLDQTNPQSVLAYAMMERSDEARLEAVLAGPQLFLSAPLFGIGWGQYQFASTQVLSYDISAHNWYAKVLAEQGLVGIVLWISLMVSVAIALRRRPRIPRLTGSALFAAYATSSLFAEPPNSFQASAVAVLMLTATIVGDWGTTPAGTGSGPAAAPPVATRALSAGRAIPQRA